MTATLIDTELPTEQQNTIFDTLTPEQKRVAIAKDIIALIKSAKFVASPGTWARVNGQGYVAERVSKIIADVNYKCQVCARGAACLAKVAIVDPEISFIDVEAIENSEFDFSLSQMELMENAFEGYKTYSHSCLTYLFYLQYPDAQERLVAIYQNVIDNNGEFVLPQLPPSCTNALPVQATEPSE